MGAAAGPVVSGVLGLGGLLGQNSANNRAQEEANQQAALQQQLIQQQQAQEQNYANQVYGQTQQGAFNPAVQIQQADVARNYQENQALGNEAAAAKTLGYRPGDTAPIGAMNATRGNYNLLASQQDTQIANQARANDLAAWAPTLPNATGASINALGENYRTDLGQEQGVGGMLGSLGPYFGGLGNLGSSGGSAAFDSNILEPGGGIDGLASAGGGATLQTAIDTGAESFGARPNPGISIPNMGITGIAGPLPAGTLPSISSAPGQSISPQAVGMVANGQAGSQSLSSLQNQVSQQGQMGSAPSVLNSAMPYNIPLNNQRQSVMNYAMPYSIGEPRQPSALTAPTQLATRVRPYSNAFA